MVQPVSDVRRRNGVFHSRRRIPSDLRDKLRLVELAISLNISDRRQADLLARRAFLVS
jgi:hypothetical protein